MRFLGKTVVTVAVYGCALALNAWLFPLSELERGVWLYLPAGARLVCTLLFQEEGAIGLLMASGMAGFFYFFPNDPALAVAGSVAATLAPYAVYRVASAAWHLRVSLEALTTSRLLILAVAYSAANTVLQRAWRAALEHDDVGPRFAAMFVGDLAGTLVFLYAAKAILALLARLRRRRR